MLRLSIVSIFFSLAVPVFAFAGTASSGWVDSGNGNPNVPVTCPSGSVMVGYKFSDGWSGGGDSSAFNGYDALCQRVQFFASSPPPAPPPPPSGPSCSVTFDQNPTTADTGTTVHWSSTSADWFYINSIGYVSGSGSAHVQP